MPDSAPAPRYALYYVPSPDSPLWRFGSATIGYDAAAGCDVALATPDGWTVRDWREATAEPRRYGFHATLKAPFRLSAGRGEEELLQAVHAFSKGRPPAALGSLRVSAIGTFVALVPAVQDDALSALAADVVTAFDPFRAPLSAEERARRRPDSLPPRERSYLERYGYPYVLDAFRFHMTLSGPLPAGRIDATRAAIEAGVARAGPLPTAVGGIALCRQDGPDRRFRILADVPFVP